MTDLQLFPALDPVTLAGLRDSIREHGVLEPIVLDQHGRILDGHHRRALADELGVHCPHVVVPVDDDDHARALATTLNTDRRHLSVDQRRQYAAVRRQQGASLRQIADELGVSHPTVMRDVREAEIGTPVPISPERVVRAGGGSYPSRRPARDIEPGDIVHSDSDEPPRLVVDVEHIDETVVLHADDGEALIVGEDQELDVEPEPEPAKAGPPTKPDLGGGISHPARYTSSLLPIFARHLVGYRKVLDPFAGTGRIHELRDLGDFDTVGVELEPEWAALNPHTIVGNALDLPFDDETFDAICTSPTYGNRFADHHNAADPEARRSYTHDLGRPLDASNSGGLHWDPRDRPGAFRSRYCEFHRQAWAEAVRVLRPGGRFVLNIKNHVRGGQLQYVCGWHVTELCRFDLTLLWHNPVETPHLAIGATAGLRAPAEWVFVFERDA